MSDTADDDARDLRPEVVSAVRERLRALETVDDQGFAGPPIDGLALRPLELGEPVLAGDAAVRVRGAARSTRRPSPCATWR